MKVLLRLFITAVLLISLWQCQFFGKKEDTVVPAENIQSQARLNAEIQIVNDLLVRADSLRTASDTAGVEQSYQQALARLDSLSVLYGEDSLYLATYQKVSDNYQDYIEALADSGEDELAADYILQDLNELYGDEIDSSLFLQEKVSENNAGKGIPIIHNAKVDKAIRYFTRGRGKRIFARWLTRTGHYEKLLKKVLREEGAPEELFYLAMIESGLNPRARSYARAVGMWQFISATGRAYGLHHSWWFDERRDPVKATRAAARHLLDLYERFGDWYLAIAGYNFNPRKIEKRLARYKVDEFWELPRLPRQTRNYIPTFLAAVTIAQNPEAYGFEKPVSDPLEFDTVTVRECVDLKVVAQCVGSTFAEIKTLNPALLRWCTPPDRKSWTLNLPKGTREVFLQKYAEVPNEKKMSWLRHRIRPGETLSTIAHRYGVSIRELKRFNKIRGSLIRAGHSLVIPVPQDRRYYRRYLSSQQRKRRSVRRTPVTHVPGREKKVYLVKKGDTLWEVAQLFGVTVTQLRRWNGLGYSRIIKPGQRLNIWLPPAGTNTDNESHPLAKNETGGPRESVPADNVSGKNFIFYTVRSGDTLWDIARAHNVSIRDLKRWNGKRTNTIRPGDQLKILQ